jgi:hypothetical protein
VQHGSQNSEHHRNGYNAQVLANFRDELCTELKKLHEIIKISLLGCDVVWLGRQVPVFQMNLLFQCSTKKMETAGSYLPNYIALHPATT